MKSLKTRMLPRLILGASVLAFTQAGAAYAQDVAAPSEPAATDGADIVVTGIRASLSQSAGIKRDAQGVVDAITAEDMGKFPDTNLAESLQRITGVSIDRSIGEGSTVTVRGFGANYNLVTLNGRQMPTSTLDGGATAPSSRLFDFANLSSDGVSAVEVYKTSRADIESGGIGSTINIRTPRPLDRPGLHGSFALSGMYDSSSNAKNTPVTPEASGILSNTFADDRIGILVTGTYQKRKGGNNEAYVGWKNARTGADTAGELAQPGDARYANITNRPTGDEVYSVPQNAGIGINDIERERINGQAVLQFRPTDTLTGTIDYTYSRNKVTVRSNSVGVYFNNNDTVSEWTDGAVASPVFYTERFKTSEGKDLSYVSNLSANRTLNNSIGANLVWKPSDRFSLEFDGHHSIAQSGPTNKYGTSTSVSTAIFGVASQTIDFTHYMPVLSYTMNPGVSALDASKIQPTGNSFRNAYFRDEINQAQLKGRYEVGGLLDSIDFGASYVDNKVHSAYGYIQNNTWGGAGPASDLPDSLFTLATIPDKYPGLKTDGGLLVQQIYTKNFETLVTTLEDLYGVCSKPQSGVAAADTCLANYTVDRHIHEKTAAPYAQANFKFDAFGRVAHLYAGLRFEKTWVDSSALVPVATGTQWVSANELVVVYSNKSDYTTLKGSYENWLPSIDFDISPLRNVKLRASYGHTIARADYGSLQGGQTINSLFRVDGGTGSQGNPGLLPYKSKNIDLSAEWYYKPDSYLSIGYFHKGVSNFIGTGQVNQSVFGLTNPADGPRYKAAVAALGAGATSNDIRQYIFANYPDSVVITGGTPGNYTGVINGLPEDNAVNFVVSTPVNNDQTANVHGWEFAIQHSLWNTGLGFILNYTIVDGDVHYDNSKPATVNQFALVGLSDTANAIAYYDKHGLQARVAYNWRASYLSGTGANPTYTAAYGQVDASASYEVIRGYTVFVEGINLTGQGRRSYQRSEEYVTGVAPGYARYTAGLRVRF
jgi:TonB-dependent receptor